MSTIATINAHALAAAATCQAKDDVRYYLNGILIEPIKDGGVRVIATNGHRIIWITDPEGTCEEKIICTFETTALTKMRQERANIVSVQRVDDTTVIASIGGLGDISKVTLVDGRYPDYEAVMPAKLHPKSGSNTVFNSAYMRTFADAAKYLRVKDTAMAFVNGKDANTSICVLFGPCHRGLHAKAVLMPLRFEGSENWWDAP